MQLVAEVDQAMSDEVHQQRVGGLGRDRGEHVGDDLWSRRVQQWEQVSLVEPAALLQDPLQITHGPLGCGDVR